MIAALLPSAAIAAYRIDFARWAGVPLLRTKFGVYETPFVAREALVRSLALLRRIGVRDLRYELAWGKPDAMAFDTVRSSGIEFAFVDAVLDRCRALGVRPLFATGYCPPFLQRSAGPSAWKDPPRDLGAWAGIERAFAAHLRGRGVRYEVWNEPDMPEGTGKMFFDGSVADYGRIYAAAARGLREGDPDAEVGGPAAAYDLRYLAPVLAGSADFASIHGYANYPTQIAGMRRALLNRPDLPILLTEYASFDDFRTDGPAVRTDAAAAFFRDADGLLRRTDVATVYWAQWIDDRLGLLARDGHRRALFNAFEAYGAMPPDRVAVAPSVDGAASGLTVLASASATEAAVIVANPTDADRSVDLRFDRLPEAKGPCRLSRIDRHHASFVDDPATEALRVDATLPPAPSWSGKVPAHGVAILAIGDPEPVAPVPRGRVVRERSWFADRASEAYADFDPATWTARLGGGSARIEVEFEGATAFRLVPTVQGRGAVTLRIEFRDRRERFGAAVASPGTGLVDLRRLAPPGWDGRRVRLGFGLADATTGSHARLRLAAP